MANDDFDNAQTDREMLERFTRKPARCTQSQLCKRDHEWCDGCNRWKHDVVSCGRDSNGAPDSPDLCFICRTSSSAAHPPTGSRARGRAT